VTLLAVSHSAPVADLGRLDEALRLARAAFDAAEDLGLLFMRTEARRGLAYVHYRRGEFDEAIRLYQQIVEMTEGREPKVSRLMMAPWHIRALVSAGRLDDALVQLSAFESLAAECQSPRAVNASIELRALLENAS
jgi:tetratricopeptide (TPR) repeat protein